MSTNQLNYVHSIDLLRGLASLFVCFYHFTNFEYNNELIFSTSSIITKIGELGKNGVYIFFVISGFVIPYALYRSNFKFRQFFFYISRRFVRIEFPYIVSIALILLVSILFSIYNKTPINFEIERFIYHILYFVPFSEYEWYNEIYWTLAIEIQFYIVLGFLFKNFIHQNKIIRLSSVILFLCSLFVLSNSNIIFYFAPIFFLGIITFLKIIKKIDNFLYYTFLIIGTIIIAYKLAIDISVFSIGTVFFILILKKEIKWGNIFGKISYSLYLTHGLIGGNFLYFTVRYTHSHFELFMLVLLALILSIFFAIIFNLFIEEPSRKLAQKINRNASK